MVSDLKHDSGEAGSSIPKKYYLSDGRHPKFLNCRILASFCRETGCGKNPGPEGRQKIAPGERSEPGV
jgi:hypothetical protein